jgi:cysteinyl-tRNA synthetase
MFHKNIKISELFYFYSFAYVEDGSVYFNMKSFETRYPNSKQFSHTLSTSEERDFVLWKKGKGIWKSPWSVGRPGWHIECSAMSTYIFGPEFDLHTGGEDLMFPHHQNEILQTKACQHKELCKNWLHVGHLHIDGQKMSKSLKNFITIGEALEKYSARCIRLCFMKHDWTKSMDFNPNTMVDVKNIDSNFNEYIRWIPSIQQKERFISLETHIGNITSFIESNFDFPAIISYMQESIKKRNIDPLSLLDICSQFGLVYEDVFSISTIEILVNFRSKIRNVIKDKKVENKAKEIFELCDGIRDIELKQLGINIDDL